MDKTIIMLLLNELNSRLREQDKKIELHIVGGASLILNGYNKSTVDIDTIDETISDIKEIVIDMSLQFDVPTDWLNNEAGGLAADIEKFVYSEKIEMSNLTCFVANDEYILACKVRATREKDFVDALEICRDLGIKHNWEIKEIYNIFYPTPSYRQNEVDQFIVRLAGSL